VASLGEFGAAVRELGEDERDDFTFFGERFDVVGAMPPILMIQLGAAATGKIDQIEGLAAVWETFRLALGDDEYARFFRIAVDKRADFQSLFGLSMALFEAQAGRPTEEPRGSSDGLSTTSPSASPSSSVWAQHELRPVAEVLAG
jgi:hypothetical protein